MSGAEKMLAPRRGSRTLNRWRRRESKTIETTPETAQIGANTLETAIVVEPHSDETSAPKPQLVESTDAIEIALANAIIEATADRRWDVVAQLARELEARRLAQSVNVVRLRDRRSGGQGGEP